jgi:hypothetical protein
MSTLNMKLSYSKKILSYWMKSKEYFSMQNEEKFMNYFFPFMHRNNISYKVYDIQDVREPMKKENINIMLCVENCKVWKHYDHINKFGDFGNKMVSIYIYNHFDKFIETSNYIVIPVIYLQVDYFKKMYPTIQPKIHTPFVKKKFCLFVTRTNTNPAKNVFEKMRKLGECHQIKEPEFDILRKKSCYHDTTLLNVLNQYKFVCCCENTIANGYITEKIFNVFFARAIPIYYGPSDKFRYFNKDSFIEITDNLADISVEKIRQLNENEALYNDFLKTTIINKEFNNENYIKRSQQFIDKIRPK